MIRLIAAISLRQLFSQRRSVFLALLPLFLILIAVIFRIAAQATDDPREFVGNHLFSTIVAGVILPLVALVFGTAVLGQDLEDGTAIYLLATPVPRWKIVAAKITVAWLATSAVVVPGVLGSGLIVLIGEPQDRILPAFLAATLLGGLVYAALFVALSIRFSRALILGAVYVFLWEALLADVLPGAQYLSVREFSLSIAHALAETAPRYVEARLGVEVSAILLAAAFLLALGYSIRALRRMELSDRTS